MERPSNPRFITNGAEEWFDMLARGEGPIEIGSMIMGVKNETVYYLGRLDHNLNVWPAVHVYFKTPEEVTAYFIELRDSGKLP